MDKEIKNKQENTEASQTKLQAFFGKKIFDSIGIKLLSLVVAVIVWMVIINIDDPYREKTFTVEVETINESALVSVNKVFEIIEGGTAQVKVKGKKSIIDKLKAGDIRATADLSNLSAVNAVAIVPTLIKNVATEPTLECNQVLKVSLENMAKKQVKVTVVTEGTPEEGHCIGDCTAKPNMVEISGGESAIEKIDSVRVTLNVSGVSQDFSKKLQPIPYDSNGDVVESSTLSYSSQRIRVSARVLQTKHIDVNVKITGEPAQGYEFVDADCLPEQIEVAGTAKALDGISKVTVPINIDGMRSNSSEVEQNISIQDYLEDGITVLGDYALVSLRIVVEKLEEKTIMVQAGDIKFASLREGLAAEPLNMSATVELVVRGRVSILNDLSESNFSAYVDCSGLSPGKYTLPVKADLGDSCTLVRAGNIKVRISKGKNDNSEAENSKEPQNTPTPDATVSPSPQATGESSNEENFSGE